MCDLIDFECEGCEVFDGVYDIREVVESGDVHAIMYANDGCIELCCEKSKSVLPHEVLERQVWRHTQSGWSSSFQQSLWSGYDSR